MLSWWSCFKCFSWHPCSLCGSDNPLNEERSNQWKVNSKTPTNNDSRILIQVLNASLYYLDNMTFILAKDKGSFYEIFLWPNWTFHQHHMVFKHYASNAERKGFISYRSYKQIHTCLKTRLKSEFLFLFQCPAHSDPWEFSSQPVILCLTASEQHTARPILPQCCLCGPWNKTVWSLSRHTGAF